MRSNFSLYESRIKIAVPFVHLAIRNKSYHILLVIWRMRYAASYIPEVRSRTEWRDMVIKFLAMTVFDRSHLCMAPAEGPWVDNVVCQQRLSFVSA